MNASRVEYLENKLGVRTSRKEKCIVVFSDETPICPLTNEAAEMALCERCEERKPTIIKFKDVE